MGDRCHGEEPADSAGSEFLTYCCKEGSANVSHKWKN